MEQCGIFRFSIDNALEMIIVFGDDGLITYANHTAKELLKYGDDLCGTKIMEVFPGVFGPDEYSLQILNGIVGKLRNVMAYRKNRTCFPAKVKVLICAEKEQKNYICTGYDASNENFLEKKVGQIQQEAEEAQKVKSEFVANVTHELRTPVNGILGNTEALIDRETDREKLDKLRLVERGCRDMNAIINNILDFSKLEAGKFILEPRKFHFRNMIDYVKGNHSNRMAEKGLDFSITISPGIPEFVIGDELRIVQVLNNLISNAYKFTSVGEVHVEIVKTAMSGDRMELFFMVSDTGIGIAKADQGKLFQSFSQTDASISRKYGGTGLGLNICKQLVELMGGDIHVESAPGRGSIFSFDIWVEAVQEETDVLAEIDGYNGFAEPAGQVEKKLLMSKLERLTRENDVDKIWKYGEEENRNELNNKMSKLILSVEMENWEKAENFAETVKQLVEDAPREVKSAALRLKMAVQKGDYEKTTAAFETLKELLQ